MAVARLRAAGALVLGTTNVAEMLMGYETVNPLHGRTHNPWDLTRTPGGSSGGESAAIAAGCSAGGLGSDGGGSIRVPAHFTGICGLKPTPGRVPSTGHQPACLGPFSIIGAVGPMARTIADVEAMYRVLSGWDAADPFATPLAADAALPDGDQWRVGWFDRHPDAPVTRGDGRRRPRAVAALDAQGMAVEAAASGRARSPRASSGTSSSARRATCCCAPRSGTTPARCRSSGPTSNRVTDRRR